MFCKTGGGVHTNIKMEKYKVTRWENIVSFHCFINYFRIDNCFNATGGASRGRGEGREIQAPTPMARGKFQQRPIYFGLLMKLAGETTDLPTIVQKLGQSDGGLRKLIEDHSSDSDILELVLVVIGNFCKENGAALFANAFITMMQTLGEKDIFRQISSVIMRIPNSRSTNLPSKNERLKKLLTSVYYLTSELIVMMPAFACNFLGEDFFVELKSLENIYSVKALNVGSSFEILEEGIVRLKVGKVLYSQYIQQSFP